MQVKCGMQAAGDHWVLPGGVNSLDPGRCVGYVECLIFKYILVLDFFKTSCEIAL